MHCYRIKRDINWLYPAGIPNEVDNEYIRECFEVKEANGRNIYKKEE